MIDSAATRRMGAQFEGVLIAQILSPLEQSLGQSGSFAIGPLAQSIAAHDAGGFGQVLASLFEKHDAK